MNFDDFFIGSDQPLQYNEKAFQKRLVKPERAGELLAKCRDMLAETDSYEAEPLEATIKQWCEDEGIGIGDIIHALRVGTTGKAAGFGMFDTLAILGRETVTARINATLDKAAIVINDRNVAVTLQGTEKHRPPSVRPSSVIPLLIGRLSNTQKVRQIGELFSFRFVHSTLAK